MKSANQPTARLLIMFACLGGCTSSPNSSETNLQQEEAELNELIDTARGHAADAQGQPVTVPTTVPKRPAGAMGSHEHEAPHDMSADHPAGSPDPTNAP